jgi:hypothetical protein
MKKLLLLVVLTCMTCAAFAVGNIIQRDFNWRNDDGDETSASWMTYQNQSTMLCGSDTFRLRILFEVQSTGNSNDPVTQSHPSQLSYATSPSGPWTTITNNSTNAFMQTTSLLVADGTPTTQQLSPSVSGTFVPGQVVDANHASTITFSLYNGSSPSVMEFEWVLIPGQTTAPGTYYFRLDGLDSYSTLPSINYAMPTASTLSATNCDSYTLNSQTYTASGTYTQTIPNAAGCDSTITLNLTVNHSNTGTATITACDQYTWIDGVTYTASNNTATHTLTNMASCDSVVTLNLTINHSNTGIATITACDQYTWIDGVTYTASNNTATHTITNMASCDSVVTLNLTINHSNTGTDVITACGSYTWIDGVTYTANNNTATHTLTNMANCDSTVMLDLTIVNIDATVSSINETITANNANATYQWVDCGNSNAPIAGETAQSFTATANGSYAVMVTENGCTEMSACTQIVSVGMHEALASAGITLYPNPNNGTFTVKAAAAVTVEVYNAVGQVVFTKTIAAGNTSIEIDNINNGVYFIASTDANGHKSIQRFVVAK